MAMNRRQMIRMLGLGAGATFLSPWVERTLAPALGQTSAGRKRLIVFAVSGFEPSKFVPDEITSGRSQDKDSLPPAVSATSSFTWPEMFSPIEDLRDNAILIDGLTNPITGGSVLHGCGFGALTCQHPQGDAASLAPPRGASIDQYMAQTLSANAPKSSLIFGISHRAFSRGWDREASLFSAGTGQSLSHATKATVLRNEIVGLASPDMSADVEGDRRQALRDVLNDDFSRLRSKLAGPERERLDIYESAIVEFDRRFELRNAVSCDGTPSADNGSATRRLDTMMDMATVALECGLTNVVGVAVGTADSHDEHLPRYDGVGEIPVHDYGGSTYGNKMNQLHQYHWSLLRRTLDTLDQGDGPDDETYILYVSTRGTSLNSSHHAQLERWPALLYAKSSRVDLGGRFVRYPSRTRSFAELCRSVSQIAGVCPDGFATGGNVAGPVNGLLPEVVGSSQNACG
jgi:hypothetical protein